MRLFTNTIFTPLPSPAKVTETTAIPSKSTSSWREPESAAILDSANDMNKPDLHVYDRLVTTPFGLLGTDENALSFALPGELFAKFQTGFYSDPRDAAFKALGVE